MIVDFKKTVGWNLRQFFNEKELPKEDINSFCRMVKAKCYDSRGLFYINVKNENLKKIIKATPDSGVFWDLRSVIVARFYL